MILAAIILALVAIMLSGAPIIVHGPRRAWRRERWAFISAAGCIAAAVILAILEGR